MLLYKKTENICKIQIKSSDLSENFKIRGSIYEAFGIGTLAWGASRDPFLRKRLVQNNVEQIIKNGGKIRKNDLQKSMSKIDAKKCGKGIPQVES